MPSDALQTGTESSIILIFLFAPRHLGQSCHTRIKHILHLIERRRAPDSFLLVPGVGAQGGSLEEVCRYGMTDNCGLLVNSSRAIIFASKGADFAVAAGNAAKALAEGMDAMLGRYSKL